MTDNNRDQEEFDPSLEDAGEDFGYEDESFNDEDFNEESWDDSLEDGGDEPADEDQQAAAPKKKGGLFNIVLIAAAVLGGGAFIYLKVLAPSSGGSESAPVPVAEAPIETPAETQQAAAVSPAPSPLTPDPVVAPLQAPASDSMLPTLAPDTPAVPAPAAPPPEDVQVAVSTEAPLTETTPAPLATAPVPAPQQPVEIATAPPMPAPISMAASPEATVKSDGDFNSGLPSAKDIMLASPAATHDAPPEAGVISADAAKSIEQKLSVLLTRLDTFEGRITNLESGLHQLSSKTTTLESKAPAGQEDVKDTLQALAHKIDRLEKEKTAAPAAESSPAATAPAAPDVSKIDTPTFVPAAPEPVEAPEETSIEKTPKTEVALKPVIKAESAAPAAAGVWVLRSAQPGTAMVMSKKDGEMRTVRVGDSLSGLGRITSIEQRGSRWVVQGTQGTLTH